MSTLDKTNTNADPSLWAAIDLGSNSFHAVLARHDGHGLQLIDRHKEPVRLAAGLSEDDRLDPDCQDRALACLERFRQLLSCVPPRHIRAVGTNTLRRAANASDLLKRAEAALGSKIEIVDGHEEARLVWLGALQDMADAPPRRLVVDIGGGSTELIVGEQGQPEALASLQIGCVVLTQRCFADGRITVKRIRNAALAADSELLPIQRKWRKSKWEVAAGTSGTAQAIAGVLAANFGGDGSITSAGMAQAIEHCISKGDTNALELEGLSKDRQPVFVAGLVAMSRIFAALRIERMRVVSTALREGLLADMIGRGGEADVRPRSVRQMAARYQLDREQADRVAATADSLFQQTANAWNLDAERDRPLLSWAAQLHEVGLAVNYSRYHRHGAYLIGESNMSGFSREEQSQLARLVLAQRKRFPLEDIPFGEDATARQLGRLAVLLRLATILHRSRSDEPAAQLRLQVDEMKIVLKFPKQWLTSHPLTLEDLEAEALQLGKIGFSLAVK